MVVCEMGWGGVGWGSVFRHFTFFFSSFFDVDPSTRSVFFFPCRRSFLSPLFIPFFLPRPLAAAALGVLANVRAPAARGVLAEPLGAAARGDGGDGGGAVLSERGRGEEGEEEGQDGGEEERERKLHFLFFFFVCVLSRETEASCVEAEVE